MRNFLTKQYNKVREKLHSFSYDAKTPLERLGSEHGGWVFPKRLMNSQSICYLAGAGTDISFDLELANAYRPKIFIFDPTPGAIAHFEDTKKGIMAENEMFTQGRKHQYPQDKKAFDAITFLNYGIWNKDETLKFYVPANKDHISHSVKNLNKTSDYFDAKVKSLSSIMAELGHDHIDLLKIDIEGAEYEVLEDIVQKKLTVKSICVEFDENFTKNIDSGYLKRITGTVEKLRSYGYLLVHREKPFDMTFIHKEYLG